MKFLERIKVSNLVGIKRIVGNSAHTYFEMSNGVIIVGNSEFRAKTGKIDGFIVYTNGLRYKDSDVCLSLQEIEKLMKQYDIYKLTNEDIVDWW